MGRSKNKFIGWSGDGVDYAKRRGRNRRDKKETVPDEYSILLNVLFAIILGLIVCALWAALSF